jgi:hypothetical protein
VVLAVIANDTDFGIRVHVHLVGRVGAATDFGHETGNQTHKERPQWSKRDADDTNVDLPKAKYCIFNRVPIIVVSQLRLGEEACSNNANHANPDTLLATPCNPRYRVAYAPPAVKSSASVNVRFFSIGRFATIGAGVKAAIISMMRFRMSRTKYAGIGSIQVKGPVASHRPQMGLHENIVTKMLAVK